MATNPYSYGTLGTRWTVGEPTSKSLLDISRVKADANRWTLEQLITDPDDSATLGFGLSFASSEQRLLQIHNTDVSNYFQIYGGRAGSPTSDHLVFSTGTNGTIMEFDGANHWITYHDTAGVQKMYYRGDGSPGLILESGVFLTVGGLITASAGISGTTGTFSGDFAINTSTLKVDTSNNRVGVKNASPSYPLDIGYTAGINQVAWRGSTNEIGFLTYGSSTDAGAVQLNSGGAAKILLDAASNSYINTGSNFGIGTSSPDTLIHAQAADGAVGGAIKYTATGVASGYLSASPDGTVLATDTAGITFRTGVTGNDPTDTGTERARIDSSGNLLVGYTSSNGSYLLQVNSQIFATSAIIATSDGRYKEDVQTLSNATDLVTRLNPVQFKWKAHEIHNLDVGKTDVGFIAQEVQAVLSDTDYSDSVVVTNKTDDEEYLGLGETKLIPLLTAALQEAITKIETLETKVAALEAA